MATSTAPLTLQFPLIVQFLVCFLALACLLALPAAGASPSVPDRGFVSSEPAENWEQGLISGNGTIGANVFGRVADETVVFTHERLFLPQGEPVVPPDTASRLGDIRGLIDKGEYQPAVELAFELSGQKSFMYPDPFVPAFDMNIQMRPEGDVADYMRSVDFQTGEAVVRWSDARGAFERKLFVSRPDKLAVMVIRGPRPGAVSCRLELAPRNFAEKLDEKDLERSERRFDELVKDVKCGAAGSALTFTNGFARAYAGSIQSLEGVAHVAARGGTTASDKSALVVTGADEVLVLVDIRLLREKDRPGLAETASRLGKTSLGYDELLARHKPVHNGIFSRMRLDLGGAADRRLTTEQLLARSTDEDVSRALIELEFDAGRYNILSCTGELPPNLQGVWAGTYNPPWASDFTHNGNVPSAIASMLMGNMPELMLAYTSYIESVVPDLKVNARNMFGARGVVLPSRSSARAYNNALATRFAGGFWVGGAPWAAHFFYDYYLYTGDRKFLAEHALPFMEQAALFFEDYLYKGPDGKFVFNPTTSPENSPSNTKSQGTFNATMDVAAVKELLNNLIAASQELAVNAEKIPLWRDMLTHMPDYMIGPDGAVKEWITDKLDDNLDHRHSSHLYALYDGIPQEIACDEKLRAAFRRVIETKLDHHWKETKTGFMSFGVVQLGQAAASLGESELAYRCLVNLVNRYWLGNMASMHNTRKLFNMDTSGGQPAVVIKMLVASEPGELKLLPALPKAWPTGTIEGVLCRGQIEIESLQWQPGGATVRLVSARNQNITLEMPAAIRALTASGADVKVQPAGRDNARKLALPAGKPVTLTISM